MKWVLLPGLGWLVAQTPTTPDLSPLAQWGVAGMLLGFVLYLFLMERKEHQQLRAKVLEDFLPALIANNEQLRDSTAAVVMVHQIASRPNIDPATFANWSRTMERTNQVLERLERKLDG